MKRLVNLGERTRRKWASAIFALCAITAIALAARIPAQAQTFTSLVSFGYTNGYYPYEMSLVQSTNGELYGTTQGGGALGRGAVFKITTGGTVTTLYNFCSQTNCTDGSNPRTGLVLATNGNFYGTSGSGGAYDTNCGVFGCGTVFKISPEGALTTLHTFDASDGYDPSGVLVSGTDGYFYGTTFQGGANDNCTYLGVGCGTVFKISPKGTLTTLYNFCAQTGCTDGSGPLAGLVQATNGNFYGTTAYGGADGAGTVFEITSNGVLRTLYSFCAQTGCTDGNDPVTGLVQATNGNFYGTTAYGGVYGAGTVFEITSLGTLTTLYSFCAQTGCTDGSNPDAGLVQATDGNFYGTTARGGANDLGTVLKITTMGTLTTLHSFDGTDGETPYGGLIQDTNGTFFGTTAFGGTTTNCTISGGCGTVFSLAVGLGPFVQTLPTSGKVGMKVTILGTKLTGATSANFNGTPAAFTVASSSAITTTVPAGATSGTIQVVTPRGTLSSNVPFTVL